MPTVNVGDIDIYYEVHGEGEPLLLITALSGDLTSWIFQIPEFSRKYRVIVFDNRGAGRTDVPDIPYSTEMMADDSAGLLNALGIEKAHILGHSMGSFIAQELALKYPQLIRSLVLASAGTQETPMGKHLIDLWTRMAREGVNREIYVRELLLWVFTDKFFENTELVQIAVDALMTSPYPQPTHGLIHQVGACLEHNTKDRISNIIAPTVVLVGKEDILVPVRMSEELAAGINGAELVVLEGAGHGVYYEAADKFNLAVLEFLSKVENQTSQSRGQVVTTDTKTKVPTEYVDQQPEGYP
jgi:3-oxoadipate enol-lactonase